MRPIYTHRNFVSVSIEISSGSSDADGDLSYAVCGPLYLQFPNLLQVPEYQVPNHSRNGLFQRYKRCEKTIFEYYESPENEPEASIFNKFMASYRSTRTPWTSIYETQDIIDGYTGGTLLVDIGGNQGDDLEKFRLAHPGNGGNLFLEDMAVVLEKASCDAEIRRIPHNFFHPRPIRGARAYYMHSILHDWNDDDALTILIHIKNAMTPGYSKLLVDDIMMAKSWRHSSPDFRRSPNDGHGFGRERTEYRFGQIFEKAGLEIVKIWKHSLPVTSIAELVVSKL